MEWEHVLSKNGDDDGCRGWLGVGVVLMGVCVWCGVYIFMVVNETHMLIRSYSKWRCHPGLLVEALWPKNRAQHLHQGTTRWWL